MTELHSSSTGAVLVACRSVGQKEDANLAISFVPTGEKAGWSPFTCPCATFLCAHDNLLPLLTLPYVSSFGGLNISENTNSGGSLIFRASVTPFGLPLSLKPLIHCTKVVIAGHFFSYIFSPLANSNLVRPRNYNTSICCP